MENVMAVAGIPAHVGVTPDPQRADLAGATAGRLPLSEVEMVPISLLEAGDSPRSGGVSTEHVRLLADVDASLPPVIVHRETMRVIDGMHRLRAAALRGEDRIAVRFFDGDERDAFILAVEENVAHGLPLSTAERAAAAARILRSHPEWSDRAIAAVAGISTKTVRTLRCEAVEIPVQPSTRVGRDGRIRPVSSAEGRLRAAELLERNPEISLRAVARETGISLGTVRDVRERLSRGEHVVPLSQRPTEHAAERGASSAAVTVRRQPQPVVDGPSISVGSLVNDPSLRLTEDGRYLLRLLATHHIPLQYGDRLADSVPPHAVVAVFEVARGCARAWQELADRLSKRIRTQSDQMHQ